MISFERGKCEVQERAVHFAIRGIMQQNMYERTVKAYAIIRTRV